MKKKNRSRGSGFEPAATVSLVLLFIGVLHGIQCHRENDDGTLDDVLPVWADPNVRHTVVDNGEDQNPRYHASDAPHTAREGHATNHTRCNGVELVQKAQVVGCATDTSRFQHPPNA